MIRQLLNSGPPLEVLHREYAKEGRIYEEAPIKTQTEIHIDAPIEQVWKHMIALTSWHQFSRAFRSVHLDSTVTVDAEFQFTLKNFTIRAKFAVVDAPHKLVWTGKSLWFKAIDLHALEAAPNGATRYVIAESFCGAFATLFMNSTQLGKQHRQWQTAFKQAVEREVP